MEKIKFLDFVNIKRASSFDENNLENIKPRLLKLLTNRKKIAGSLMEDRENDQLLFAFEYTNDQIAALLNLKICK